MQRTVRDLSKQRGVRRPWWEVAVLDSGLRGLSVQAIKMSHGFPGPSFRVGIWQGEEHITQTEERRIALHRPSAGIEYPIAPLLTNGFLRV